MPLFEPHLIQEIEYEESGTFKSEVSFVFISNGNIVAAIPV